VWQTRNRGQFSPQQSGSWTRRYFVRVRRMQCGPICHTTQHQTNTIHQLETRSESNWDGRTPNSLGQILWVRIPTVLLDCRCLRKVREERVSLLLIAPVWRAQPWYPALLDQLVDCPLILLSSQTLLTDPFGTPHLHMAAGQLQLAAWKLSGRDSKRQEFQEKLHNSWWLDGAKGQMLHTRVHGNDGIAGVLNDRLI